MDHDTQLSKMDPKLKEAYERVMGTSGSTPHTTSPANAQPPSSETMTEPPLTDPAPTHEHITSASPNSIEPSLTTPPVTPVPAPTETPPPISVPPLRRSTETVHVQATHVTKHDVHPNHSVEIGKKKFTISPVIITLLLIVFFAVYTFVWIKILNVPIPFLP